MSEQIRAVVAGVALSPHAPLIAIAAAAIAERLNARPVYVHAGEESELKREKLEQLLRMAGIPENHDLLIQDVDPVDAVSDTAARYDAAMIVAGALEEEGMLQRIVGSVARRIARKAECPVLLLPLQVQGLPRFERVVVGARFDDDIAPVLAYVTALLRAMGVRAFTIVQEVGFVNRLTARYASDEEREEFENDQRRILLDYLSVFDLSGFTVDVDVLEESAEGVASVDYARSVGADLLVFQAPSRSLTIWDRLFTHPAESVLSSLPCSMLLFRAEQLREAKE